MVTLGIGFLSKFIGDDVDNLIFSELTLKVLGTAILAHSHSLTS